MNDDTPWLQAQYLMKTEKIKKYKRQCLILACALYETCLTISQDKEQAQHLMEEMLKNQRTHIYSMSDSYLDNFLAKFKS